MSIAPRTIERGGHIFAHYIPREYRPDGINFLTPDDYSIQAGLLSHPAGHTIQDHLHNPKAHFDVKSYQEFLYLESGSIQVKIYDLDWSLIDTLELRPGDILLQVYGGHGFDVTEKSCLIEVKQGPYSKDQKMRFTRLDVPDGITT